MDDLKPKKITLEEVLGQRLNKNEDAEVIGEILYAIQQTEYLITLIIGMWSLPMIFRRLDYMLDNLLMRIPWQDKIKFIESFEFLTNEESGQLQKIFQDRNFLAHPRPLTKKVVNKFPLKERSRILSFLKQIDSKLAEKMDFLKSELIEERTAIRNSSN